MNRSSIVIASLLVAAGFILAGCGNTTASGTPTCREGICVDLTLGEPIKYQEATALTVTVRTETDVKGLAVLLQTDSNSALVLEDGQWVSRGPSLEGRPLQERGGWRVDTKANQLVHIASAIILPADGHYRMAALAVKLPLGPDVTDSVRIYVTREGGVLNPTPVPYTGTPRPLVTVTGGSPTPTPALPREKPTTGDRSLPRLLPAEVLARCGWTAGPTPVAPWDDAWLWADVPEQVPLNTPVTVIVGLEMGSKNEAPTQATLGLCLAGSNIIVDGPREWRADVKPGVVITRDVRVTFGQAGEAELLVGVYDAASGRAASGGQRTRVVAGSVLQSAPQAIGWWMSVQQETFELYWPGSYWAVEDKSTDGYERFWARDDYRAHNGYFAVWPARGGADGLEPTPGTDHYFNNMNTRMIFGPFDLSDAVIADADFWLWQDIETRYDYLSFEVSHDGIAFEEKARWDGSEPWAFQDIYFNEYCGDNSVWIAWRFFSDSSITFDGPWIDSIRIWKYVAGDVAASGTLHYYDRNDAYVPARFMQAYLFDADPGGTDDLLASTTTDGSGFVQFPTMQNWDADDSSQNPIARRLDLYVVWETDTNDGPSRRRVTHLDGNVWQWASGVSVDAADGPITVDRALPNSSDSEAAMWILDDMHRGRDYVVARTGDSPGTADVRWEHSVDCYTFVGEVCNSGFWPGPPLYGIFIADAQVGSRETALHELSHQYMYTAMGQWFWQWEQISDWHTCIEHGVFSTGETALCAWTEGWADFLPMAVEGTSMVGIYDLETLTWPVPPDPNPIGDTVEGRVAGALHDLYDTTNDGWDQTSYGFAPLWNLLRTSPRETTFAEFWQSWQNGSYQRHLAVQSIYQNTINYNSAPAIAGLPDIMLLQDTGRDNSIDLWSYASDSESSDAELAYVVAGASDPRCGVTIDPQHNVDIAPQSGWWGACTVTIQASDGISASTDSFIVQVNAIIALEYLPVVLREYQTPPYPIMRR